MADVTSSKAAEILGVAHSTMRAWCRKDLVPEARLEETALGPVWMIPESSLKNFKPPKLGRPRKPQDEKVSEKESKKRGGKK